MGLLFQAAFLLQDGSSGERPLPLGSGPSPKFFPTALKRSHWLHPSAILIRTPLTTSALFCTVYWQELLPSTATPRVSPPLVMRLQPRLRPSARRPAMRAA